MLGFSRTVRPLSTLSSTSCYLEPNVDLSSVLGTWLYLFYPIQHFSHRTNLFSMITSAWKNERNRLQVDSVKSELQLCNSFSEEWSHTHTKKKEISTQKPTPGKQTQTNNTINMTVSTFLEISKWHSSLPSSHIHFLIWNCGPVNK